MGFSRNHLIEKYILMQLNQIFFKATEVVLFPPKSFSTRLCLRIQVLLLLIACLILSSFISFALRNGGGSRSAKFPADLLLSDSHTQSWDKNGRSYAWSRDK